MTLTSSVFPGMHFCQGCLDENQADPKFLDRYHPRCSRHEVMVKRGNETRFVPASEVKPGDRIRKGMEWE